MIVLLNEFWRPCGALVIRRGGSGCSQLDALSYGFHRPVKAIAREYQKCCGAGRSAHRACGRFVDLGIVARDEVSRAARRIRGGLRPLRQFTLFMSVVMLALNVTERLLAENYGKAAFYAVGPVLLIDWAEVSPGMLQSGS
jgi:hypothetical protein